MKEFKYSSFEYKTYFPIYLPIYYHEDGRHRQNTAQLFAFPTQADKTEAITGQVAYHILSVVKQKPSGRTKCKIKNEKLFPQKNKPPVSLLFQGSGGSSTKKNKPF